MKGDTGVQTMNGYVSRRTKEHRFSVSQVTGEAKQGKAVSCMEDNRALIDEQLDLLETIQGENTKKPVSGGVIQGRIPNYTELNGLHKRLSVDVIREKVSILLRNLQLEGLILQGDGERASVDRLIKPDGKVDKTYYEQLFGQVGKEGKEKVYHNAKKAKTDLEEKDMSLFFTSIEKARGCVSMTINNMPWLKCVFGSESGKARDNYNKIMDKLSGVGRSIKVTTDYNGDSEQWGIGGYADSDKQTIHFLQTMCGKDPKSPITAIHECAHLVDPGIGDLGYAGSPGFELMTEKDKINNAAHYEIVPCWISSLSCPYPPGTGFKESVPGNNNVDLGKKQAADYFQRAHLIAFNYADKIRRIYSGDRQMTPGVIMYSKAMGLTIHSNKRQEVTLLDVTLAENIAHVLVDMYKSIRENKETIEKYRDFPPEVYKAHFKNMAFKTCLLEGVTWQQVDVLNNWDTSNR